MAPVGSQRLRRPLLGKLLRGFCLPALALSAHTVQLRKPGSLSNRPEGRTSADGLKLLMIANEDDLCAPRLHLFNEARHLAAADHTGFIDHENIASADLVALSRPALRPRASVRLSIPDDSCKPKVALPDRAAPWTR